MRFTICHGFEVNRKVQISHEGAIPAEEKVTAVILQDAAVIEGAVVMLSDTYVIRVDNFNGNPAKKPADETLQASPKVEEVKKARPMVFPGIGASQL